MAKRKTLEQWLALINKQQHSELTVRDFCRENRISASCFYTYKAKLKSHSQTGFSQAIIQPVSQPSAIQPQQAIALTMAVGELTFPAQTPSSLIVDIIKGLQS